MRNGTYRPLERSSSFSFLVWQVPTLVLAAAVGAIGTAATASPVVAIASVAGLSAIATASAADVFLASTDDTQRLSVVLTHLLGVGVIAAPLVQVVPSSFLLLLHPSMWLAYRCGFVGAVVALAWGAFVFTAPRSQGDPGFGYPGERAAPAVVALLVIASTVVVAAVVGRRNTQLRALLAEEAEQRARAAELADDRMLTLEAAFEALNAAVVLVGPTGETRMNNRARALNTRAGLSERGEGDETSFYDLDNNRLSAAESGLRRAVRGDLFESLIHRVGPPGDQVVLSMTTLPLVRDDGVKFGQVLTAFDMTDLAEASAQREDLVSTISHELQTPLTAISAAVEAMPSLRDDPDDLMRLVALVDRQAKVLSGRVEQLLRSRTAHETVDGNAARLTAAAIEERVRPHREVAARKGVTFTLSVQVPDGPRAHTSPTDAVLEVCDQVISNAVKFVAADGQVEVTVEAGDDAIIFRCADSGPGMTPDEVRQATNMFYRSRRAISGAYAGLGLGLTIIHRLVTAADGHLTIDSAPHSGTLVEVSLPAHSLTRRKDGPPPTSGNRDDPAACMPTMRP